MNRQHPGASEPGPSEEARDRAHPPHETSEPDAPPAPDAPPEPDAPPAPGEPPAPVEPPAAEPHPGQAEESAARPAPAHGPTAQGNTAHADTSQDPAGPYPAAPEAPHTRATPDPHGAAPPSGTATPIQAGWYPDPQEDAHQRYWDGRGWTFHTAPRQDLDRSGRPPVAAGTATPSASRLSRGAWAGIVAGAALLIALAIFTGQQIFGGGPEAMPTVTLDPPSESDDYFVSTDTEDTDAPDGTGDDGDSDDTGAIRVEGEEFTAGEDVEGSLDAGEEWVGSVVVEQDALVLFDASPDSFADLTMEIRSEDDELLVANDDRSDLSQFGGARLDPLITADLPAGTYTVVVGTYNAAEASDFTLVTAMPEAVAGADEQVEVAEDSLAGRTVEISDDGNYTITASSDLGEVSMVVIDSFDNSAYVADATSDGAEWAGYLSAGRHLLLIADDERRAFELTLEIGSS